MQQINLFVALIIIIIIILIYNNCINPNDLDNKILKGWWYASDEFCKSSGISYLFLNFDYGDSYIVSGDDKGIIYNTPISISIKNKKNTTARGTYIINIDSPDEAELPFPDKSIMVLDRTNTSMTIYKDDMLYCYLLKK